MSFEVFSPICSHVNETKKKIVKNQSLGPWLGDAGGILDGDCEWFSPDIKMGSASMSGHTGIWDAGSTGEGCKASMLGGVAASRVGACGGGATGTGGIIWWGIEVVLGTYVASITCVDTVSSLVCCGGGLLWVRITGRGELAQKASILQCKASRAVGFDPVLVIVSPFHNCPRFVPFCGMGTLLFL